LRFIGAGCSPARRSRRRRHAQRRRVIAALRQQRITSLSRMRRQLRSSSLAWWCAGGAARRVPAATSGKITKAARAACGRQTALRTSVKHSSYRARCGAGAAPISKERSRKVKQNMLAEHNQAAAMTPASSAAHNAWRRPARVPRISRVSPRTLFEYLHRLFWRAYHARTSSAPTGISAQRSAVQAAHKAPARAFHRAGGARLHLYDRAGGSGGVATLERRAGGAWRNSAAAARGRAARGGRRRHLRLALARFLGSGACLRFPRHTISLRLPRKRLGANQRHAHIARHGICAGALPGFGCRSMFIVEHGDGAHAASSTWRSVRVCDADSRGRKYNVNKRHRVFFFTYFAAMYHHVQTRHNAAFRLIDEGDDARQRRAAVRRAEGAAGAATAALGGSDYRT